MISAPPAEAYSERRIKQEGDQCCIQIKTWHIGREKLSPSSEPPVAFQLNLREERHSPFSPASILGKVWQCHQGTQACLQPEAEELALEASDMG